MPAESTMPLLDEKVLGRADSTVTGLEHSEPAGLVTSRLEQLLERVPVYGDRQL